MLKKGTLVTLILFCLLLAGFLVLEHYGVTDFLTKKENEPADEIVWLEFKTDEIESFSYLISGNKQITYNRLDDTSWKQDENGTPIDAGLIERFLVELHSISPLVVLNQVPDLNASGLGSPRLSITINGNNGSNLRIHFGNSNPIQTGYYAQIGSGNVVIISNGSIQNLLSIIDEIQASFPEGD